MDITVAPVGYVRGARAEAKDDYWGGTTCRIELVEGYSADSLAGLADFSHVEVVFVFDRVDPGAVETTARHPRNREDWPLVGIFGQRGKRRPNRLGVSRCGLVAVDGTTIVVEGLDAIEGTPVLDIKPWLAELGPRGAVRQPAWSSELMADYYADANEPGRDGTRTPTVTGPQLCQTVLDGTDIRTLAEFYRALFGLGYRPGDEPPAPGEPDDADWLVLRAPDGGRALAFQRTDELTPTTWPSPQVPMQLHLDTTVPDVASLVAARDRAVELGGRLLLDQVDDPEEPLYVIADPAGHPFCIFVA